MLGPAEHEANGPVEEQIDPRVPGVTSVEDMYDPPSPLLGAIGENLRLLGACIGGFDALAPSPAPPAHHGHPGGTGGGKEASNAHAQPFEAGDEHRTATRRVVKARLDTLETGGLRGTHG